jgi:hypothetical protein
MASTPSSATSSQNLFADHVPSAAAASVLQHVNIRTHVLITLYYGDATFSAWSVFFDTTFRKFGLLDHIDGTVDAQQMWHNIDWLQADQCIISWLYTSVTASMMQMVQVPKPTTYTIWSVIRGLFLDNTDPSMTTLAVSNTLSISFVTSGTLCLILPW